MYAVPLDPLQGAAPLDSCPCEVGTVCRAKYTFGGTAQALTILNSFMSSSTSTSKGKQPESQSSQIQQSPGPSANRPLGSIASTDELAPTPRAIGSLARKQDPTTRAGTQRMKFVPTLPLRRKKPE